MANYTKSTNFTAKDSLPSGNSGKIIKGTEIDVELSAVAAAILSKADTASPAFTGTPSAPTAAAGTNSTQIATTAFVLSNGVPSGAIMLWSGSIESIPTGWYLCDGNNSTPDLTDKFIVGAGSAYAVGETGGSANAIVVSHTHTATSTSTVTDPGHVHTDTGAYQVWGSTSGPDSNQAWSGTHSTSSATTGITVATSTSLSTAGSDGTDANLPPYYALAYIMKA
jgi:hypothetical protein